MAAAPNYNEPGLDLLEEGIHRYIEVLDRGGWRDIFIIKAIEPGTFVELVQIVFFFGRLGISVLIAVGVAALLEDALWSGVTPAFLID